MSEARISAERLIAHVLLLLVSTALLWILLPMAWRYLSPFIIAFPFATLVQPAARALEKRFRIPHNLAVYIPLIFLFLIIASMLIWFLVFGFNQISYLLSHSSDVASDASAIFQQAVNTILERLEGIPPENATMLRSLSDSITQLFSSGLTTWAARALNMMVGWATSVPYMLLYGNFLVFGIFFIARDFDRLMEGFHSGTLGNPDTSTGKITNSAFVGLMGWLRCQAVYALLSLVAGSIYWTAFGYQYGILISIAAAILEFLPIVGNGTIYLPWGAIGFLVGAPKGALLALILYFGLLFIRRITEPKLLSSNIGVSPLLSLISMFVGMELGGILGMIGSPMIAAVLTTLWKGEFRYTIMHDAHVVYRYLADRWQGVSAQEAQHEAETPVPSETPKKPAPPAAAPQQLPGKKKQTWPRNIRKSRK